MKTLDKVHLTWKRVVVYVLGLFFLSLGVSFSIQADFGVSPVSSLAYAFTLSMGLSVGITTLIANVLFIVMQVILNKTFDMKDFITQLVIAFLFGFFMDATLFLVQILPTPDTIITRSFYLIISLFIVAIGLLGYLTSKLPLMPYDALTYVISERFKLEFSKAKVTSDLLNVGVAAAVCLMFVQSFGAVGVGTIIAAIFIGKILGLFMKLFKARLEQWLKEDDETRGKKQKKEQVNEHYLSSDSKANI